MGGRVQGNNQEGNKMSEIKPCPKCGGEVEWTNSRDLNILGSYMKCGDCDMNMFHVETVIFLDIDLPDLDYETTLLKYNAWCDTNPTQYCEDNWG